MDDSAESSDADGDDISENTGEKETNSYSQRGTSSIELSKSRKRKLETRKDTKFVESWLDVKEFKEWLLKRKGRWKSETILQDLSTGNKFDQDWYSATHGVRKTSKEN